MRIETQSPENIHQVGNPDGNAAALHHGMQNGIDANDPVGDGVFGVKAQMNELGGLHESSIKRGI